jgi:hypothetical protein
MSVVERQHSGSSSSSSSSEHEKFTEVDRMKPWWRAAWRRGPAAA